jgi:mannose-6-phosphate isomerase
MMQPIPVVFEPIFKARPWGGRMLERLFAKQLPGGPIGESWELVSLPGNESRVAAGPLAGRTIQELIETWQSGLTGRAALVESRFPLLIKFLDAAENLSVQVHPRPSAAGSDDLRGGVKHEAWYVIHAASSASIYVGASQGVTIDDFRRVGSAPGVLELLRKWPVKSGDCFYLPSGVPHALGGGVVVAEVQTPSDVTYRLYDWDRRGLDGKPRELHIEAALANLRCDVPSEQIVQPRRHVGGSLCTVTHLMHCARFQIDRLRLSEGFTQTMPHAEPAVWIVLAGRGTFRRDSQSCGFTAGDVVLIPADSATTHVTATADCDILEVTIPIRSDLAGLPHPTFETPADPRAPVKLGLPRRP